MTNDPRLVYRTLAASALLVVLFFLHYLTDLPSDFYAVFSPFYMAAYGAAEVYYDNRKPKRRTAKHKQP